MNKQIIREVFEDRVEYKCNGLLHREDGPAIVHSNGNQFWYVNGLLHREDGTAIEKYNGEHEWFICGVKYYTQQCLN